MAALLIGYARCSTDQQDLTAQHDGLTALGVCPARIYGSPGMSVDHPGLGSWGRRRVIGPQESITRASAAWAEWNP